MNLCVPGLGAAVIGLSSGHGRRRLLWSPLLVRRRRHDDDRQRQFCSHEAEGVRQTSGRRHHQERNRGVRGSTGTIEQRDEGEAAASAALKISAFEDTLNTPDCRQSVSSGGVYQWWSRLPLWPHGQPLITGLEAAKCS